MGGAKEETHRTISTREDIWMLIKILKMLISTRVITGAAECRQATPDSNNRYEEDVPKISISSS
jgi:hypothetical protein